LFAGTTFLGHDTMGRAVSQSQTQTGGGTNVTKNVGYAYNLDGSISTITYPSGNSVMYTVGTAGRVTQVSDPSNSYVSAATYTPNGAVVGLTNGNAGGQGIVTANQYNSRLQPAVLSAASPSGTIFSLSYGYNSGHNNGNIALITNGVRTDATANLAFLYDPLNRIQQANTTTTGQLCWGETYTIDPWGNLTNIAGVQSMGSCYSENQNIPVSANNQITGYCYDGAGNLLDIGACAAQSHSYVYDAEGQLQSPPAVGAINAQMAYTYYYDGDGNRAQKCNANPCTSGSTPGTLYWRGAGGGEVLDESSRTGNGTIQEEYIYFNGQRIARRDVGTGNVHYYFSDHLGSASVIADGSNGNVQEQMDFYPYGGIAYTSGADSNHYKFTGKERDGESNLDNFGARYYASTMGRFMIPDWSSRPTAVPYAELPNPQSLNLYSYVDNNPLNRTDPLGHGIRCVLGWGHCGAKVWNENNPNGAGTPAQNQGGFWQKLAGIFYVKGSVSVGLELGVEAHAGKAKSPLKLGAKIGADMKSTGTLTTKGITVSATKEAQLGLNVGKLIIGPQKSTEEVTVKNGEALAQHEVEKSSSALVGTEKAEATLSKGDVGVGAEVDAAVISVGIEVGVDVDKAKELFNPHE